jgi:hypothetical protein
MSFTNRTVALAPVLPRFGGDHHDAPKPLHVRARSAKYLRRPCTIALIALVHAHYHIYRLTLFLSTASLSLKLITLTRIIFHPIPAPCHNPHPTKFLALIGLEKHSTRLHSATSSGEVEIDEGVCGRGCVADTRAPVTGHVTMWVRPAEAEAFAGEGGGGEDEGESGEVHYWRRWVWWLVLMELRLS